MTNAASFATVRAVVKCRAQWSARLAKASKAMTTLAVAIAWSLVADAFLAGGPWEALALVALATSIVAVPLYVVANASLRCIKRV